MRDNPALQHVPMAVGGEGMLVRNLFVIYLFFFCRNDLLLKSTSNYLARQFGVRAAMPGFIARQLCPNLVIVPCDFDKYRIDSSKVM